MNTSVFQRTRFFLVVIFSFFVATQGFNTTNWDVLLQKYVIVGKSLEGIPVNEVDYVGISKDPLFSTWLNEIASANITGFNAEETISFYTNVYNTFAVNVVIIHACETDLFGSCGPIKSIRDIGSLLPWSPVWNKPAGSVAGKEMSLQDVEDFLVNPVPFVEDPRIHTAIVCASISCPNLRNQSYTATQLDVQLTESFNEFISNTAKGMSVNQNTGEVMLSSIFDWYAPQFISAANRIGNTTYASVIDFILIYLDPLNPNFTYLKTNKNIVKVSYFHYNWDLNAATGVPCSTPNRLCYPLWGLLVTIGVVVILLAITIVVVCFIKNRRRRHYQRIQYY